MRATTGRPSPLLLYSTLDSSGRNTRQPVFSGPVRLKDEQTSISHSRVKIQSTARVPFLHSSQQPRTSSPYLFLCIIFCLGCVNSRPYLTLPSLVTKLGKAVSTVMIHIVSRGDMSRRRRKRKKASVWKLQFDRWMNGLGNVSCFSMLGY